MNSDLVNNDFLITREIIGNVYIKTLSNLNGDQNIDSYVKKFINLKFFPYVNSDYGDIISSYFDETSYEDKIEIIGELNKLLYEIEELKHSKFMEMSDEQITELMQFNDAGQINRETEYENFRGGEYGEMLLATMLSSIGYDKILSKLHIQWSNLSPTGIDIPFINIDKKELILCESKLWKNTSQALRSIKNDINDILYGNKFDYELIEWNKRVKGMPSKVRNWYVSNYPLPAGKKYFEDEFKIIVFAVVMSEYVSNDENLKNLISRIFPKEDKKDKYTVVLCVVSIEDKKKMLSACVKAVEELFNEVVNI